MRDYKEWTGKERLASLKKTKAAIAEGIIPPPTKCNRCGKTTGRIDYHNHDYSDPIKYLEQICQGCHTRLHRLENSELNCKNSNENVSSNIVGIANEASVLNEIKEEVQFVEIPVMDAMDSEIEIGSDWPSSELNMWIEKGMNLPLEDLAGHIRTTPVGVKPLHALRSLGIVFSGGHTKLYDCAGYPQASGLGKDREKFDVIVERIRFHEKNGESLKVKGLHLSEKLESNYTHNR